MADNPFDENYMRGYKEGEKHSNPSPETRRWMNRIENGLGSVQTEVHDLKEEIRDLGKSEKLNQLSRNALFSLIGLIVTSVVGALLMLVIQS